MSHRKKTKQFAKSFLGFIVVLSLVFQFLPSREPVQAISLSGIGSWLKKLASKVAIPNITLNEKGELKAGQYVLFNCLAGKDSKGNCLEKNPFDGFRLSWGNKAIKSQKALIEPAAIPGCIDKLFEGKSLQEKAAGLLQLKEIPAECINPNKGELAIPKPYVPEVCEKGIPLPSDQDDANEIVKLAKNKACIYLNRLQEAAAQEVFLANKIFNSTDPFTDCLFIKNCRSNCSLRMGEVVFTVTLLDIAALFVPGGFLTVIQKILNIAKMIKLAWDVYNGLKGLFNDGVRFVSQIFDVMGQVSALFKSFTNTGLKWSDVLIYGGGAVASYFGGQKLQTIGLDKGGNIGWLIEKGGDALMAGDGLVGGAAATMVFNKDRAQKASNNMQDLLRNFAQNNLKFSLAKAEAIQFNNTVKGEIENLKKVFEAEPQIAFLFYPENENEAKKRFNALLNDFSVVFETVDGFLNDLISVGTSKNGKKFSEIYDEAQSDDYWNDDQKPIMARPFVCFHRYDYSYYIPSQIDDVYVCPSEDNLPDLSLYQCQAPEAGAGISGFVCFLPDRANPFTTCLKSPTGDTAGQKENQCDWFSLFKKIVNDDVYKMAEKFRLLDAQFVRNDLMPRVVENGKAVRDKEKEDHIIVDYRNDTWRLHWENLGRNLNVAVDQKLKDKSLTMEKRHQQIMDDCIRFYPPLINLKEIEEDSKGSFLGQQGFYSANNTNAWLDKYEQAKTTYDKSDTAPVNTGAWKPAFAVTDIIKDINQLAQFQERLAFSQKPEQHLNRQGKYWQDVKWMAKFLPPNSELNEKFTTSYDSDLAFEDWDEKINVIKNKEGKLEEVKNALQFGVSPEDPIIVYKIEQAKKDLNDIITAALSLDKDSQSKDLVALVIEAIKKDIKDNCLTPNEKDYNNFSNCCKDGTKFSGFSNCCNLNEKCDEGYQQALLQYNNYAVSCNTCLGKCPAASCKQGCSDNYSNVCIPQAKKDAKNKCSGRTGSNYTFCYNHYYYGDDWEGINWGGDYDGYKGSCKKIRDNCDSACDTNEQTCLTNCNAPSGDCGLRDKYQEQHKCFEKNNDYFKPGYDEYTHCQEQINILNDPAQKEKLSNAVKILAEGLLQVIDAFKTPFVELKNQWERPLPDFEPHNQDSAISRALVERIIQARAQSEIILNQKLPELVSQLDQTKQFQATIQKFIDQAKLDQKWKDKLSNEIVAKFNKIITTVQTEVIDIVQAKLGPQKIGTNYQCNAGKCLGSAENTFLCRLKCFEKSNNRTFDQVLAFMDVLFSIENAGFAVEQVGQILPGIEPSYDMQTVQIKPNLAEEITSKAEKCVTVCGKDCAANFVDGCVLGSEDTKCEKWSACYKNCRETNKCNEHTTLYVGQPTDESNFDYFKNNLLANPLSTLEEKFTTMRANLDSASLASAAALLDNAKNAIRDNDVFGRDGSKKNAYEAQFKDMQTKTRRLWEDLIWGNDVAENIRLACDATSQILGSDPADIEKQCLERTNKPENIDLLEANNQNYSQLTTSCKILTKLDLDFLENLQKDPDYITKRISALNSQRNCITREDCQGCSGLSCPCIVCPKHFCVNPTSSTWGAGMADIDPFCLKVMKGQEPGKVINNIVWDTQQFVGEPKSSDLIKPDVCEMAGIGYNLILKTYSCTKAELDAKCSGMSKVDLTTFDKFPNCKQSSDIIEAQELIEQRACIAKEQCGWGFVETLYGRAVKSTTISGKKQPCISCPKWICADSLTNKKLLPANALLDPYCKNVKDNKIAGAALEDNDNIVWDALLPSGWRKWPPETVCLQEDGKTRISGSAIKPTLLSGIETQCIEKQKKLFDLENQAGGTVVSCPWDIENWPCKNKDECSNLQGACDKNQDGTALKSNVGLDNWAWPPTTKCPEDRDSNRFRFAKKYLGAQNMCIGTQQEIINLQEMQKTIDDIKTKSCPDCPDAPAAIEFLMNKCNKLEYQESFEQDCHNFDVLKQVFSGQSNGRVSDNEVKTARKAVDGFCRIKTNAKIITKTISSQRNYSEFKCSSIGDNIGIDLTASTQEAQEARDLANKLCTQASSDIRTPLNEIMKVFSVLLGIKSYTAAKNGLGALYFDAQKLRQRVQDVVNLIQGFPEKFMELWGQEDAISKITKGDVDIKPVMCVQGPMVSYAGGGKALTGPKGGQVCPDVSEQFSQLDGTFSLVRQNLRLIKLAMTKPITYFGLFEDKTGNDRLKIEIARDEDIDPELEKVVGPIYDRAEEIKEKSQLLWALATAINFANENCTCGQSYCPMINKVPFCVSGLPTTVSPLKEPFCHLVWTLRYPLGSLAEKIKQDIERPLSK